MALVARVVDFTLGRHGLRRGRRRSTSCSCCSGRPRPRRWRRPSSRIVEAVVRARGERRSAACRSAAGRPARSSAGPRRPRCAGFAAFPIETNGRLTGLLALGGRAAARIDAETQRLPEPVANQAHIVVENSRLFERVHEPLHPRQPDRPLQPPPPWSCWPRRWSAPAATRSRSACSCSTSTTSRRSTTSTATWRATRVLREVARLLQDSLRTVDAVGRYGGEEFLVAAPAHRATTRPGGWPSASGAQSEACVFRVGERTHRLTVSMGVLQLPVAAGGHGRGPDPRSRPRPLPRQGGGPQPGQVGGRAVTDHRRGAEDAGHKRNA